MGRTDAARHGELATPFPCNGPRDRLHPDQRGRSRMRRREFIAGLRSAAGLPADSEIPVGEIIDLSSPTNSNSELDFGQFSGLGNGHFSDISDASANFPTVLGVPGTYQISLCTPYSRAFRASARSKIGQSPAEASSARQTPNVQAESSHQPWRARRPEEVLPASVLVRR
jgi:hypothetical protein